MFRPRSLPLAEIPFRLFLLLLVTLPALALLSACGAAVGPVVTVIDDDVPVELTGQFDTVGQALTAAGITLNPGDVVLPDPSAPLDTLLPITIDRARPVQLLTAAGEQALWTQAETVGTFLDEAGVPLNAGERVLADNVEVAAVALYDHPLPAQVIIDPYKTVSLVVDGQSQAVRTAAVSVAETLVELGVVTGPYDTIDPAPDTLLAADMVIRLERAAPYRIMVDGETREVSSGYDRVAGILAEAGVALVGLDRVQPAEDATVQPGDTIQVIRVTETFESVDEPIPYDTVYQADETMPLDTQAVASTGSPGVLRRQTRVVWENGVEVAREPAGEWVAVPPVNDVINYGTQIAVQTMDTPDGPIEYWRVVNMRVASYTPSSAGKAPGEPGYGITASGRQAGIGVVAVDPRVIPFRSNVYVPGYGVAFAGDTGGGVKGRFIDLGYSDDNYQHWSGFVDVYYLTPVPAADKIRYILP